MLNETSSPEPTILGYNHIRRAHHALSYLHPRNSTKGRRQPTEDIVQILHGRHPTRLLRPAWSRDGSSVGVAGHVNRHRHRHFDMGTREDQGWEEEEFGRLLPAGWEGGVFEWRRVWEG